MSVGPRFIQAIAVAISDSCLYHVSMAAWGGRQDVEKKRGIGYDSVGGYNWIGFTWIFKYNNGLMPSLNQISKGLVSEAMVQLRLAMGDVKNQQTVIVAQANIQKTWEDLLQKVQLQDRDQPLGEIKKSNEFDGYIYGGPLCL